MYTVNSVYQEVCTSVFCIRSESHHTWGLGGRNNWVPPALRILGRAKRRSPTCPRVYLGGQMDWAPPIIRLPRGRKGLLIGPTSPQGTWWSEKTESQQPSGYLGVGNYWVRPDFRAPGDLKGLSPTTVVPKLREDKRTGTRKTDWYFDNLSVHMLSCALVTTHNSLDIGIGAPLCIIDCTAVEYYYPVMNSFLQPWRPRPRLL